jgi:hypothetical protein
MTRAQGGPDRLTPCGHGHLGTLPGRGRRLRAPSIAPVRRRILRSRVESYESSCAGAARQYDASQLVSKSCQLS